MKRYYLIIIALITLIFLISCGNSSYSGSGGTSLVTITVGDGKVARLEIEKNTLLAQAKNFLADLLKPDSAVAAIPSDISNVSFTISASDIITITKEVLISGQTSVTETFSVPNGSNRYFLVDAKNSVGKVLYSGSSTADLNGTPITLDINMSALDVTPPAVISISPANNTVGVAVNTTVTATFSEAMDASTINKSTFTLSSSSGDIAGTVTYNGTTATFTPLSNLSNNTTYTATLTTGAKDLAGNAMVSNYTWTFNTEWAFVGKWGSTVLEHRNDGSWASAAGTITFNSDGTGSNTYTIDDNGTLTSKTEDFTYTTTLNSDGSMYLTQTYSTGTVKQRIVLSDDGSVFIEDG
ncbi:MAG: Ig-like domain-containing protein, partial [Nitrospirae bacterium]|nr:Ig-like domain-containing protein [Nitrospirota bacterium]